VSVDLARLGQRLQHRGRRLVLPGRLQDLGVGRQSHEVLGQQLHRPLQQAAGLFEALEPRRDLARAQRQGRCVDRRARPAESN
jgi:hypothetical protein